MIWLYNVSFSIPPIGFPFPPKAFRFTMPPPTANENTISSSKKRANVSARLRLDILILSSVSTRLQLEM